MTEQPRADRFSSLVARAERASSVLANAGMFAMMATIAMDTFMRYVLNNPITGSHAVITLYLMPLLIFGTASLLEREDGNINVDILRRNFSPLADQVVDLISHVGALLVFGVIAYLTFGQATARIADNATLAGAIRLPTGYSWLIVSLGLALLSIRLAVRIVADVRAIASITRGDGAAIDGGSD